MKIYLKFAYFFFKYIDIFFKTYYFIRDSSIYNNRIKVSRWDAKSRFKKPRKITSLLGGEREIKRYRTLVRRSLLSRGLGGI